MYSGLKWNFDSCVGLDILTEEIVLKLKLLETLVPILKGGEGWPVEQFNEIPEKQYCCPVISLSFITQEGHLAEQVSQSLSRWLTYYVSNSLLSSYILCVMDKACLAADEEFLGLNAFLHFIEILHTSYEGL